MDRELYLIRHAQAESMEINQKDIDRILTQKGSQDAMRLGNLIKTNGVVPDYIICSTAQRTRETAGYICEQIIFDANKIFFSEDLYESSVRIMLKIINGLDNSYEKIFLIAHNPAISYLAEYVTGEVIGNVSPGGMVHLKLKKSGWDMLSQNNAELVKYHDPINL